MPRASFTTPALVDAVVYRTLPSNPTWADEKVVAFGELDVTFSNTLGAHDPVYFKATVEIGSDKTLTVVKFEPLYGAIGGAAKSFLDLYVELFEDCLRRNARLVEIS